MNPSPALLSLLELAEKATPGHAAISSCRRYDGYNVVSKIDSATEIGLFPNANDARFFYEARNAIPELRALLADVREREAVAQSMTDDQIKHMVDRFLGWRLPENFNPDGGISFKPTFNDHLPKPMKHEPIGTNLFDASQAEQMVRYMVYGMPIPPSQQAADVGGLAKEIWSRLGREVADCEPPAWIEEQIRKHLVSPREGWVMVPREPTKEMLKAGNLCMKAVHGEASGEIYRDMLAAAPVAPEGEK